MRILIVDDSKAMRSIVMRAMRQAGYDKHTYEEAGNGAEAFKAIQASPPDLVLCDWNMPEMNGIELLQKLRAGGDTTKFGFVTSESTPEIKDLALKSGALFLISKPFNADVLQKAIGPVLS